MSKCPFRISGRADYNIIKRGNFGLVLNIIITPSPQVMIAKVLIRSKILFCNHDNGISGVTYPPTSTLGVAFLKWARLKLAKISGLSNSWYFVLLWPKPPQVVIQRDWRHGARVSQREHGSRGNREPSTWLAVSSTSHLLWWVGRYIPLYILSIHKTSQYL